MIIYTNSPQNTGHRIPIYFFVFNADNTLLKNAGNWKAVLFQ